MAENRHKPESNKKKKSWKANMKDTANNPTQHVLISCHPLETLKAKQETVVRKS